ncbi:hypothetical protein ACP70R_009943 [Stipagrostis hirtigluma subsp. patula]
MAEEHGSGGPGCCFLISCIVVVYAFLYLVFFVLVPTNNAEYSVAVAGVAGLDPAADLSAPGQPALSPVFNVTVRVDNGRSRLYIACVDRLSTVSVSYGDALLGKGSVPQFCAESREVQERGARAWGLDVAVPRFLRDQLAGELAAGEAAVDVKVTTPAGCRRCGDEVLICSNAKIGGGPSPCQRDVVYAPAAGSEGVFIGGLKLA